MESLWNSFLELLPGNWEVFEQRAIWEFLLKGLWINVQIAIYSIILSIVIGVIAAVARLAPLRPVRWLAATYVELFRATPVLLLLFYVFFGAATFNTGWMRDVPVLSLFVDDNNGDLTPIASAVIALTLYNSAVIAEVMRAGILSISKGIMEASRAIGLTYLQSMRYVAVPIALRRMSPGLVSQLITLYKDTSLAATIAVVEVLRRGALIYDSTLYGNPTIEVLLVIALFFFIPNYLLSRLAARLEHGPETRRGGEGGPVTTTATEVGQGA